MSKKGSPKADSWGSQGGPTNQGLSPFCSPGRPWDRKCLQDLSQRLSKPPKAPLLMIWGRCSARSLISLGRCFGSKFDDFGSISGSIFSSAFGSKADFLTTHSPNSTNVSELPGSLQGQTMGASSEGVANARSHRCQELALGTVAGRPKASGLNLQRRNCRGQPATC